MAGLAILVLAMVAAVGILFALRIEDMSAGDTDADHSDAGYPDVEDKDVEGKDVEDKDVEGKDGQFARVSTDELTSR